PPATKYIKYIYREKCKVFFHLQNKIRAFQDRLFLVKFLDRLVSVSFTCHHTSTPDLSTSSSMRDLTHTRDGKSHLEGGFMLRCFQHLSLPHVATQRCSWRNNWYTSGVSIPFLSYQGQLLSDFQRPRRIGTDLSHDVLNPARVPLYWANSPTLGTDYSPRMR